MAMLLIVISLAAPSLGRFFRGRTLDAEVRRFVTLTRYGQSRAVSEGLPMILWIDPEQRCYGLQAEASYEETDDKAVEFDLNESLEMEVEDPPIANSLLPRETLSAMPDNRPFIRFTPEGFVSETSPENIRIRENEDEGVWIVRSRNRLSYEVQTNQFETARR